MTDKQLFFVSNQPSEGLQPVYKFENEDVKGNIIWSRSEQPKLQIMRDDGSSSNYNNAGIAWYTEKHDELYEPLHSSQLRSRVTADERLRIQPKNSFNTIGDKNSQIQRTSPLTSYIDLSNYDSNSIKLNITQFSRIGILDIDGFGQSKDLILYNNSNQYVSVNYKPNSVVIMKNT